MSLLFSVTSLWNPNRTWSLQISYVNVYDTLNVIVNYVGRIMGFLVTFCGTHRFLIRWNKMADNWIWLRWMLSHVTPSNPISVLSRNWKLAFCPNFSVKWNYSVPVMLYVTLCIGLFCLNGVNGGKQTSNFHALKKHSHHEHHARFIR